MEPHESQHNTASDPSVQLENLTAGIREIAHEINNPLGIIRMAAYFLQTTDPDSKKRDHYFRVIEDGLSRIEQLLQDLKNLRDGFAPKGRGGTSMAQK